MSLEASFMDKAYQHRDRESFWSNYWVENRVFSNISHRENTSPFCIMIPPPNVTGSLHMGHAFEDTLIDIQVRSHAQKGQQVLWQVGVDHAGIATQMVVDRQLESQGINVKTLSREDRIQKIWEWKEQSGGSILSQLKRIGCGIDWDRERFTLDSDYHDAVIKAFVKLYRDGLILKKKRLVNWDVQLQSAVSDLEVDSKEEASTLYTLRYECSNNPELALHVATTRPETLFGDVAIAVHPDDLRYASWIGKTVRIPLTQKNIPVIADQHIVQDFGTGCVKITPAHDFFDFDVATRHNLPFCNILNPDGTLNDEAGAYAGLERFTARAKMLTDLDGAGLLIEAKAHVSMIPRCSRTDQIIEPYLTDQWYLSMQSLAQNALDAHARADFVFIPEQWNASFRQWLDNIQDWCISRQLIWGHRIPAWTDAHGTIYVGYDEHDVRCHYHLDPHTQLTQDSDVLDTWFSSALWPMATLGWPEKEFLKSPFFPNNCLISGFDIIFFWVARMIMFSLYFTENVPFQKIFLHGIVQDHDGQKMSKSKGNVIDPIDLIDGISYDDLVTKRTQGLMQPEKKKQIISMTKKAYPTGFPSFGVDPLRLALCLQASPGRFVRFDVQKLHIQQQTCHKLWNLLRFSLPHMQDIRKPAPHITHPLNRWICSELYRVMNETQDALKHFRYDLYASMLVDFMWTQVCDRYVEFVKILMTSEYQDETRWTLTHVIESLLSLLHPVIPFITEELSSIIHQEFKADIKYECLVNHNHETRIKEYAYIDDRHEDV
ncbi:MAG: valine--tRNA ligase, partial [Gammaproteobacteria bacterium]|nr:valine--tRNA ligase [Gammaproteobacteria bacterium]